MYDPLVLRFRASTFSAALLLFPRSSPAGVGVGVGVGFAIADGEMAGQASATAMRITAEAEVPEDLTIRCFRTRPTEVWIRVFISVVAFCYLVLVCGFYCVEISARDVGLVSAAAAQSGVDSALVAQANRSVERTIRLRCKG